MVDTQRQRKLFADLSAVFIEHGQPIAIGIGTEANIVRGILRYFAYVPQVLFGGLGHMQKFTVGLGPDDRHLTAKLVE